MEPAPSLSSDAAAKDALRIQAAAVAAQQAALDDEEARLQQQRGALEQQEEQLAAHLEEKRRRLVQLREEAQAARLALQKERTVYQETVEKTRHDLAQAQKEVHQEKDKAQADRKRLVELRRRLKRRWHRHWMAQRQALRARESELATQLRQLAKDREGARQERAEAAQERLRATSERELGKRQLQDEWQKLRQEQQAWNAHRLREQAELKQRAHVLECSEAVVTRAERDLAYDRHQWQGLSLLLEREAEGLNARILHQRRKIVEQQEKINQLNTVLSGANPAVAAEEKLPKQEAQGVPAEHDPHQRLQALERLAGDLADQRLQLIAQWERLALTQDRWQRDRDTAAAELEALAARLPEREQALVAREQQLAAAAADVERRHRAQLHQRHRLEAWQVRLRAREVAWEAERDRLLLGVRSREAASARLQAAIVELRRRWVKRRKEELEQLGRERAANDKLRQEWRALREQCWRRSATLEEQGRALAEKELALERASQQYLTGTEDAVAAERRMERLRRRWARQNAAVVQATTEGLRKLQTEAAQLAAQYALLQKQNDQLTQREISVTERQTALEQREALTRIQEIRMTEEVQRLRTQRDRQDQQNEELHEEVERIALMLLAESSEILPREAAA